MTSGLEREVRAEERLSVRGSVILLPAVVPKHSFRAHRSSYLVKDSKSQKAQCTRYCVKAWDEDGAESSHEIFYAPLTCVVKMRLRCQVWAEEPMIKLTNSLLD